MADHHRSIRTRKIVRIRERVAPAARTARDIAQPIAWYFAFKDEAASMIKIVLAAFADSITALFDFML
ncbi:hypothetical protein ACIGO9_36710 [Nocardia asteroides]|uniref:hypothetical protein n=1 Tax=Nocardia asteroides TaxID=1824 RepID=UPI0037CA36EA